MGGPGVREVAAQAGTTPSASARAANRTGVVTQPEQRRQDRSRAGGAPASTILSAGVPGLSTAWYTSTTLSSAARYGC